LVQELNSALGLDYGLSEWQFDKIRAYELEDMVDKAYEPRERATPAADADTAEAEYDGNGQGRLSFTES